MNKRTEIIGYIFCLIAGLLLTIFSQQLRVLDWVVMVMGILFVIPSLISVVTLCIPPKDKNAPRHWFMIVPGAAGLILGILMICMPDVFTHLLTWLFAIVLIVFGIYQIAIEIRAERDFNTSKFLLIVPVLITVAGIVILCMGPERIQAAAALITGIALLIYSANGLVGFVHLKSRKRQMQLLAPQSASEDIKGRE